MASLLPFSVPKLNVIRACSSLPATTLSIPETLDEKFGRKGIKFLECDNVPIVELTVRNGSSIRLRIPDAQVTSYKPKVHWKDDGFEEVLYTIPAGGADSTKAKGGIGLVINALSEPGSKGSSVVPTSEWTIKDVDSDAIDALQILVVTVAPEETPLLDELMSPDECNHSSPAPVGWRVKACRSMQ